MVSPIGSSLNQVEYAHFRSAVKAQTMEVADSASDVNVPIFQLRIQSGWLLSYDRIGERANGLNRDTDFVIGR